MQGVSEFADWLPNSMVDLLQNGAGLPTAGVAEAVAVAVAASLFVAFAHTTTSILGGLRNVASGRSLVKRRDGALGGLRRIAFVAVCALPWYNVLLILTNGELASDGSNGAILAGVAWLLLTAVDHRATWLDLGDGAVIARRGFAIFRRNTLTLSLGQVFRTPGGDPVDDVARVKGRAVAIAPEAIAALAAFRGGEAKATAYLTLVLTRAGGKIAR